MPSLAQRSAERAALKDSQQQAQRQAMAEQKTQEMRAIMDRHNGIMNGAAATNAKSNQAPQQDPAAYAKVMNALGQGSAGGMPMDRRPPPVDTQPQLAPGQQTGTNPRPPELSKAQLNSQLGGARPPMQGIAPPKQFGQPNSQFGQASSGPSMAQTTAAVNAFGQPGKPQASSGFGAPPAQAAKPLGGAGNAWGAPPAAAPAGATFAKGGMVRGWGKARGGRAAKIR